MKTKQNVFADLDFDFEEAENLRIRADLMLELQLKLIREFQAVYTGGA
jgi:predicted XRE-type DNA-binding protein